MSSLVNVVSNNLLNNRNLRSFLIVSTILLLWVELIKFISHNGFLNSWQRRKIMHCLTGPIFLLTWPLFSHDKVGGLYAGFVPAFMTLKFLLIGLGVLSDEDTVKSMSRSGNKAELLRGPLYYGIIFSLSTILLWRKTSAIISMFTLCFGDGFAEIIGRLYGKRKLFWSKEKSWAGSLGFLFASTLSSVVFLLLYPQIADDFTNLDIKFMTRLLFINIFSAFVESFPISDIDNLTVFSAAVVADKIFTNYFLSPSVIANKIRFEF